MSYVRRSATSDVYVYPHVGGFLVCNNCALQPDDDDPAYDYTTPEPDAMNDHLWRHAWAGHKVPDIREIYAEMKADYEEWASE